MAQTDAVIITVVMAVLNSRVTLRRCIASILAQTAGGVELVVIDGGSTDGSVEILQSYGARIAYWISEPDRGVYNALNKALARARGQWIYIIGADDYLWSRDVFERAIPHLERAYPPARVVYGEEAFVNERGEILSILGMPWHKVRRGFFAYMSLPHQAVFHHRSLFAEHGGFDETFRVAGDYEMLLRELKRGEAVFVPGLIVAAYQFGGGSSTPRNNLQVLREWRRAQRLNGYRLPSLRWVLAVTEVSLRILLCRTLGETRGRRMFDRLRLAFGKAPFWTRI
ncbi:MAG TPA: glycosyltransferase family 2 protein [Dehalococcoidia bacterium]|jgi:glycosyltransferase involved in cell wall biosynthesis|nr:glycosyltransferase family 2 protein [Dehalococcoidia bacterium]